jgi:hypothetical protein
LYGKHLPNLKSKKQALAIWSSFLAKTRDQLPHLQLPVVLENNKNYLPEITTFYLVVWHATSNLANIQVQSKASSTPQAGRAGLIVHAD